MFEILRVLAMEDLGRSTTGKISLKYLPYVDGVIGTMEMMRWQSLEINRGTRTDHA